MVGEHLDSNLNYGKIREKVGELMKGWHRQDPKK